MPIHEIPTQIALERINRGDPLSASNARFMRKQDWRRSYLNIAREPGESAHDYTERKSLAYIIRAAATISVVDMLADQRMMDISSDTQVTRQWLESHIIPQVGVGIAKVQEITQTLPLSADGSLFAQSVIEGLRYSDKGVSFSDIADATRSIITSNAETVGIFFPRYLRTVQAVCERELGVFPTYEQFSQIALASTHIVTLPATGLSRDFGGYNFLLEGDTLATRGTSDHTEFMYDPDKFTLMQARRGSYIMVLKSEADTVLKASLTRSKAISDEILVEAGMDGRKEVARTCPARAKDPNVDGAENLITGMLKYTLQR